MIHVYSSGIFRFLLIQNKNINRKIPEKKNFDSLKGFKKEKFLQFLNKPSYLFNSPVLKLKSK